MSKLICYVILLISSILRNVVYKELLVMRVTHVMGIFFGLWILSVSFSFLLEVVTGRNVNFEYA